MRCRWGYLRADPDVLPPYVASIHYATICRWFVGGLSVVAKQSVPVAINANIKRLSGGVIVGRHGKNPADAVEGCIAGRWSHTIIPAYASAKRTHYRLQCEHLRKSAGRPSPRPQPMPSPSGRIQINRPIVCAEDINPRAHRPAAKGY
jgi:hypothetical protein